MINNNVILTIAIPFYNAEKYLAKAIDSVIWQTHQDFKLILLDDGSTDSSLTIAQSYAAKDNRIIVVSDGENKNLGFRLNQIPYLVDTKYLARMDADDIMHPEKIEKQIKILIENQNIDVLGTNAYTINDIDEVVGIRVDPKDRNELIEVSGFIHPTIMAKTEWFKNNPYDIKAIRIEDAELWYRTSKFNNFQILTEPLFYYREFNGGYYKKYLAAQKSKKYILSKYPKNSFWLKYYRKNFISGKIYQFFNFFNKEYFLINRRNEVVFKKKINYRELLKC